MPAAPAAAFALAGLTGMGGAIGGVDEHATAEPVAFVGRENTVVFRTTAATPNKARIAVDVANMRSGPGLTYDKIGKLPNGIVVTVLERSADWFHVRSPAGAVGWVALAVLVLDEGSTEKVVAAKNTPAKPMVLHATTTAGAVNLRRGPGTGFASLGKLPKGLSVDLLSRQARWYRVETPAGVLGWVTADFLQIPTGVAEQVPASAEAVGSGAAPVAAVQSAPTGVVKSGKSNLRTGPSTAFVSLGQLASNTTLTLVARYGDWVKVRTPKGTLGWISGALLNVSSATLGRVPVTNDVPAAPAKPAAAAATSSRWSWPTRGRLTSGFGWRWGVLHNGLDIANAKWTPVTAARAGTVIEAGWCSGYGWCVRINHGDGLVSEYGHMAARPIVGVGQRVAAGTRIGSMGSTYDRRGGGYSTGVHLHFTIKSYGRALNPLKYLP